MRFDEVELDPLPAAEGEHLAPPPGSASRLRRFAALLTDLSIFVAVGFVLVPFLPEEPGWMHFAAFGGFVLMLSYYYFVGAWMLWGKTVGGAIFDVRVVSSTASAISFTSASIRWVAVLLSLATAGLGFALAVLPSRLSLPDRMSRTRCA